VLFDAHNHLQDERFAPELKAVLERAGNAGVTRMMSCATGAPGDWDRLRAIADCNPDNVCVSLGLHPWHLATAQQGWKALLELALNSNRYGIGEVGLDAQHSNAAPIEDQMAALAWQLDLACERGLPVTLHCLGAWDKLYELLHTRPTLRFMLHGYAASPELTRELVKLGSYFSIGPSALNPRRKPVGPGIVCIPRDRIMIETDAPDGFAQSPTRDAKPRNGEPADLKDLCEHLAVLYARPASELERLSYDNALHFFAPSLSK
jgi:TatD DNase family protein